MQTLVIEMPEIPAADDEVFTFEDMDGNFTFINATKVRRHVSRYDRAAQFARVPIARENYLHILNNNGIEQGKIDRLVARPDIYAQPILLIEWHDGTVICIDGNHRLVLLYRMGLRSIGAYIVPKSTWEQFTVDFPQELGPIAVRND